MDISVEILTEKMDNSTKSRYLCNRAYTGSKNNSHPTTPHPKRSNNQENRYCTFIQSFHSNMYIDLSVRLYGRKWFTVPELQNAVQVFNDSKINSCS